MPLRSVRGVVAAAIAAGATCLACSSGGGGTANGGTEDSTSSTPAPSGAIFTAPQPWTEDVADLPVSDRSDAIIAALTEMGGWGTDDQLQIDFSIPVHFADSSTPRMPVVGRADDDGYCYSPDAPDCEPVPTEMPVPRDAFVEGSEDLTCDTTDETAGQGDCHLLVVERDEGTLYETYKASLEGDDIVTKVFVEWDLDRPYPSTLRGAQCTSADAGGFPIAALTPRVEEVASGEVAHALRFILPNDRINASEYVAPATHAGRPESTDPDAPPYGVRLRLRADVDTSGYSPGEQVILEALQTYGMLLSDGGGVPLTFASDRGKDTTWAELGIDAHSFADIGADQFEVVDLGEGIPITYDCVRSD
jgi:hypothetical protein